MRFPQFPSGASSVQKEEALRRPIDSATLGVDRIRKVFPMRSELHLMRKTWHMLCGLAIVSFYLADFPHSIILAVLAGLFAWSVTMEFLRLRNPALNEKCIRFFHGIIRSNELNKVSGMPYYLASSIIAISLFPKPVAVLSLLYLAIGDPVASFFGVLFKKRSVALINGKSFHGTAAGFTICALMTLVYLGSLGIHGLTLIRLSLLGGFAGALAELLPLELDDNFSIPVISGFILWLGFIAVYFV